LNVDNPIRGRIRTLLTNPRWLLFLTLALAGGSSLAAFNYYLFPYMKELGANESMMGLVIVVGMLSEIPVLFFGNRLIKRFKPYGLLMLSIAVTGLRSLLFAASANSGLILAIQLLNGLTVPAMWIAGVSYADENAPPGMGATAQGLFNGMFLGFGMAVGGVIGGLLLESVGGRGLFLAFGIAAFCVVLLVALLQRCLPTDEQVMPSVVAD
jgi:MFS family permease